MVCFDLVDENSDEKVRQIYLSNIVLVQCSEFDSERYEGCSVKRVDYNNILCISYPSFASLKFVRESNFNDIMTNDYMPSCVNIECEFANYKKRCYRSSSSVDLLGVDFILEQLQTAEAS